MRKRRNPKSPDGRHAERRRSGDCSTRRGDNPRMTAFGLWRPRHGHGGGWPGNRRGGGKRAGAAALGRIRGRDANRGTDGRAEAACRRQMPGPIRRDCPLRPDEQMVCTASTQDNCPTVPNPDQPDSNLDNFGDACPPPNCQADCQSKACGTDGCGGSCGGCGPDSTCVEGACT
jgi:hypothetical protein